MLILKLDVISNKLFIYTCRLTYFFMMYNSYYDNLLLYLTLLREYSIKYYCTMYKTLEFIGICRINSCPKNQ